MAVRSEHHPHGGAFRIIALVLLLLVGTQCSHLTKFAPRSKERPAKAESEEATEDDEAAPALEDADRYRLIARDQTPFFRWLRTGLKEGAAPSQFLEANTTVELLEENEEQSFSRVRLASKQKGWVPSRLLSPLPSPALEAEDPAHLAPEADPASEGLDPLDNPDPAALPSDGDPPVLGPIDPTTIPEPYIPDVDVNARSDG